MLILAWYGKKNTGKLSYFCPSVHLRKLIQFSWLIRGLISSVSFSETQGHIICCLQPCGFTRFAVSLSSPNKHLLTRHWGQGKIFFSRNNYSSEEQKKQTVTKHSYKMKWHILSSTDHISGYVWGWRDMDRESLGAEREMKNQMRYDTWAKFYGWWTFTDLQEPHLFSKLLTNDSSLFFL